MLIFIMKFAPGLHTSQYLGHFENNTYYVIAPINFFYALGKKKVLSVTRNNKAKRSLITQNPHEVKVCT
jgi:hypothetical protein